MRQFCEKRDCEALEIRRKQVLRDGKSSRFLFSWRWHEQVNNQQLSPIRSALDFYKVTIVESFGLMNLELIIYWFLNRSTGFTVALTYLLIKWWSVRHNISTQFLPCLSYVHFHPLAKERLLSDDKTIFSTVSCVFIFLHAEPRPGRFSTLQANLKLVHCLSRSR